MFKRNRKSILIGDRVRCYAFPGVSDLDFITGVVVGHCSLAGLARLIVAAESQTRSGQEEPCLRTFFEPIGCAVNVGNPVRRAIALPQGA